MTGVLLGTEFLVRLRWTSCNSYLATDDAAWAEVLRVRRALPPETDRPGKILSMASAPVVRTGRSSLLYTTSVVLVLECPARRAISSTGTPELDMSDTKE